VKTPTLFNSGTGETRKGYRLLRQAELVSDMEARTAWY
jgi:hypothetical protein